jgi:hypothetical protein
MATIRRSRHSLPRPVLVSTLASTLTTEATRYAELVLKITDIPVSPREIVDRVAREPVPETEVDAEVANIHRRLRNELDELGVSDREVAVWLVCARQLLEYLTFLVQTYRRRPRGLATVFRRPLANTDKLVKGAVGLDRIMFDAMSRVGHESLDLIERADRLWHGKLRPVIRYLHPDVHTARTAGAWLTALMRAKTGKPQVGVVAAILLDARLIAQNPRCWDPRLTDRARIDGRRWCVLRAAGKRRRVCCPPDTLDDLRCRRATLALEQLIGEKRGGK